MARNPSAPVVRIALLLAILGVVASSGLGSIGPSLVEGQDAEPQDPEDEESEGEGEGEDESGVPDGDWDLSVLAEPFHPLARAIEARDYEHAARLAKEIKRQASKEGWDKEEKRKLKFLTTVIKELKGAQRVADKKRRSVKDLQALVALTHKNRDTFAYLHFQELENQVRAVVPIVSLDTFEPPLSSIRMVEPFDFFSPVTWRVPPPPYGFLTAESGKVFQGRYALEYRDSHEMRNYVLEMPVRIHDDWRDFRHLHITAKIAKPTDGSLEIRAFKPNGYYFILKLASWKGWKTHRIDFKKIGLRHNTYLKFDWGPIERLRFALVGGVSDFYIDDLYLSR